MHGPTSPPLRGCFHSLLGGGRAAVAAAAGALAVGALAALAALGRYVARARRAALAATLAAKEEDEYSSVRQERLADSPGPPLWK